MMQSLLSHRSLVLVFLALLVRLSAAEAPPELPAELFFRKPQVTQLRFSPDGKAVAMLHSREGRLNLAVVELETMTARPLTAMKRQDIASFQWVGNDRLLFEFDDEGNEFFGLYVVGRDGQNFRELAGTGLAQIAKGKLNPRQLVPLSYIEGDDERMLVLSNERFAAFTDVYLLDLKTGRKSLHVVNPGNITYWLADRRGVVRLAIAQELDRVEVRHRLSSEHEWETLAQFKSGAEEWLPLGFDGDDKTLFVTSAPNRAAPAVFKYDVITRSLGELVLGDPVYAAGNLIYNRARRRVVGISYEAERPRVHWLDPQFQEFQRVVDATFPGTRNWIADATPDGKKLVIFTSSDREPGVYYLMDLERRKIEEIAVTRPWIDPAKMAEMRPVEFAARDGLKLHGYLTLPAGREPKQLPLILVPHGGPFGIRDAWGFDSEVQFLANRGYAVLQINYRGSGGYGEAFERAGYRQWGKAMQDDLTDGVRWVVEQGIADPKRIVIFGTSYGGYAAMAGLVFTPELYCAGVNIAGVTDLELLMRDFTRWVPVRQQAYERRIGHPKRDAEMLRAASPLRFADRIRAPVLMAYGLNDPRVDIEHGYKMEKALKRARKPHEFILEKDEGHGYRKEENSVQLYERIDAFLKRVVPAARGVAP